MVDWLGPLFQTSPTCEPMRPTILSQFITLSSIVVLLLPAAGAQQRPHIVFILADDLGYGDLECYNPASQIETPHLNRLAAEGVRFTDAHAGGNYCVPSRYSLLTGRFSPRMESRPNQGPVIQEGLPTVASLLGDQGYHTAMVGKWHLGFVGQEGDVWTTKLDYSQPLRGGPLDRGFDSFFGLHASLDIPPYFYIRDREAAPAPTETVEAGTSVGGEENWNAIQGAFWREGPIAVGYRHDEVTPRLADEALRIIAQHAEKQADAPLLLYLALPSPHTPWLPTSEFRGKSRAGMYGDFVMQVDAVVGAVAAELAKHGMRDDTLLFFSSDNGPVWFDKDMDRFNHDSVGGLRGRKASSWEGGHRMPFVVRWPGRIPPGSTAGKTVAFSDLFATLAEMLGVDPQPEGAAADSVSFLSSLMDPSLAPPRPPIVHDSGTIRDGDWKLITHRGGGKRLLSSQYASTGELYNLRDDPGERNNLIAQEPERAEDLRDQLRSILRQ